MDIQHNMNDHLWYWVRPNKDEIWKVSGRVIEFVETGHKSMMYRMKRDSTMQRNIGMYELDVISPIDIIGPYTE